MVAYSFAARFADQVALGAKTQTIRAHRRRHAWPGEPVQLYAGLRTKAARKLVDPDPVCVSVEAVTLDIPAESEGRAARVAVGLDALRLLDDAFAQADGFRDVGDMVRFWRATHGAGLFTGVLIGWRLVAAERMAA